MGVVEGGVKGGVEGVVSGGRGNEGWAREKQGVVLV